MYLLIAFRKLIIAKFHNSYDSEWKLNSWFFSIIYFNISYGIEWIFRLN